MAYEVTKNESIADAYEKQMSIINEDGSIKEYEYDCELAPALILTQNSFAMALLISIKFTPLTSTVLA